MPQGRQTRRSERLGSGGRRDGGPLNVVVWGGGERVVCVHGSLGIRAAITTMTERPPWEAEIPLDALAGAGFPALVVSGRWDNLAAGEQALGRRAFGAVCDTVARSLDAGRVIIDGWAHGCQYSGEPFNRTLRSFWEPAATRPSAESRDGFAGGLR